MRPRSRQKHKGRTESGSFTRLPHALQDSANWQQCSATGIKLLLDIARQYKGRNNGDLCAALSVLRPRGWRSSDTVGTALRELRHYGLLLLTRQGGLHRPSLYALTWHPIDDCGGKLDVAATNVAPGDWKEARQPFVRPSKKREATTPSGVEGAASRCNRAAGSRDSPASRG